MKTLKKVLPFIPEIILLLVSLLWIYDLFAGNPLNYFLVAISVAIITLLILRNKYLALGLSILLGIGNCYMILAVISEFREFPAGDSAGTSLLLTGILIFTTFLFIAVAMPVKYFKRDKSY